MTVDREAKQATDQKFYLCFPNLFVLEYLTVNPILKENNKTSELFSATMLANVIKLLNVKDAKEAATKFKTRNEVLSLVVKQFERDNPFLHEIDKLAKTLEDMDRTADRQYLSS